jgi:hypothetical protein
MKFGIASAQARDQSRDFFTERSSAPSPDRSVRGWHHPFRSFDHNHHQDQVAPGGVMKPPTLVRRRRSPSPPGSVLVPWLIVARSRPGLCLSIAGTRRLGSRLANPTRT